MNSTNENRLENPDKPTLFLDIDGVLATTAQYYTNRKKWHPTYDCYRFDEKCVGVFNAIIEKINPFIILSSDWKDHYTVLQMNEIFVWNGVNAVVSDVTGSLWGEKYTALSQLEECRSNEILDYVNTHKLTNWCAVDDLNLKTWIPNNSVHITRVNEGIKQSGIKDKILKIFNHE